MSEPSELDALIRDLERAALPDPHDEREVLNAPLLRRAAEALARLRAPAQPAEPTDDAALTDEDRAVIERMAKPYGSRRFPVAVLFGESVALHFKQALAARVAELTKLLGIAREHDMEQVNQLADAQAQVARLEADAKRYRWLRERWPNFGVPPHLMNTEEGRHMYNVSVAGTQTIDAAIDAAMKGSP